MTEVKFFSLNENTHLGNYPTLPCFLYPAIFTKAPYVVTDTTYVNKKWKISKRTFLCDFRFCTFTLRSNLSLQNAVHWWNPIQPGWLSLIRLFHHTCRGTHEENIQPLTTASEDASQCLCDANEYMNLPDGFRSRTLYCNLKSIYK